MQILTSAPTATGPGKENERAEVLALIDGKGASSRLMLLIRGSNSFAYRGLYAVDVRSTNVASGSDWTLGLGLPGYPRFVRPACHLTLAAQGLYRILVAMPAAGQGMRLHAELGRTYDPTYSRRHPLHCSRRTKECDGRCVC